MATTPTNKQIPSEDVRDLKFNAGKIDEVVNSGSPTYKDRFGIDRYTIEGIRKTLSPLGKGYTLAEANSSLRLNFHLYEFPFITNQSCFCNT